jgi:hypothetical protein
LSPVKVQVAAIAACSQGLRKAAKFANPGERA